MLRLFVNPLTADNKYSVLNRDNLWQYVQMQLSQFFFELSNFRFNFAHFRKSNDPQS